MAAILGTSRQWRKTKSSPALYARLTGSVLTTRFAQCLVPATHQHHRHSAAAVTLSTALTIPS
jgi:hypothetical protein